MSSVRWTSVASEELTKCWLDAGGLARGGITAAVAEFDRLAATSPADIGEGRESNRRIAIIEPIIFEFRLDPPGSVVVMHVRLLRRRGRT